MNLGRPSFWESGTDARRREVFYQLQREAASRPGAVLVITPIGSFWMSPIEAKLYEAMRKEGLDPLPQCCIEGYYVDFAFPDIRIAVEADGAVHGDDRHRERDRKRDWILGRAGRTVKRFHGSTIHNKASNCAFVINREVKARRDWAIAYVRQKELKRQKRKDALLQPFRKIAQFLMRAGNR